MCHLMRNYTQLSDEERFVIARLLHHRLSLREIARVLERSPSTISREVRRNNYPNRPRSYSWYHAINMASGRRRRERYGTHFTEELLRLVDDLLREDFSPEQMSGYLRRTGELSISYETIYRHIIDNRRRGGRLYKHLRCARKQRRKRYGAYDSRGRLGGKLRLDERPPGAINRSRIGHWEIDTVMGKNRACILTLVDRKTGYVLIGKLANRTAAATNRRLRQLIERHAGNVHTITADNGCEFHGYAEVEESYEVKSYFAPPYHSWERGSNENANGLIRQYLPKGKCLENLTQAQCDRIAERLNNRPRKRLDYYTPAEKYLG